MSEEYKNRGILHKLHKVGTPSKNILIKAVVKTSLAAETTALFAKDAITNRFVGKEFHIRFERNQHKSGKFKTDIKIVRANAPLYKPKGIFHKLAYSGRFFEGDVPLQKRQRIKHLPKSKVGKVAYYATNPLISTGKLTFKVAKKITKATVLTAESTLIKSASFGLNKFKQKLSNSSDTLDGGKAVLSAITAVRNLNNARKYIIRYKEGRKEYAQLKQSFKAQKLKTKNSKKTFRLQKKSYKALKRKQRKTLRVVSQVYKPHSKSKTVKALQHLKIYARKRQLTSDYHSEKRQLKSDYHSEKSYLKKLNGSDRKTVKQYQTKRKKQIIVVKSVYKRSNIDSVKLIQKAKVCHRLQKPKRLLNKRIKTRKLQIKHKKADYKSALAFHSKQFRAIRNKSKAKFKTIRKIYKPKNVKSKLQKFSQKRRIRKNIRLKRLLPKKKVKLEKKVYKNQQHLKKLLKNQKKRNRVVPIVVLPLVPLATGAKQLSASARQKLLMSDPDNDALQAVDKSAVVVKKTLKTAKSAKKKLQRKTEATQKNKLHKQANRLQQKKQTPAKKKKYKKKKPKQTLKQKAQETAKKAAKKTVKIAVDFTKFAFKMFGIMLLPIISIIIIFAILMLMFTGTAGNSSYILGTYNAQDRYLSEATENYTKIAYDFNQKILKCKSDWKNGLSDLGVDTSSYNTTPKNFYFGQSTEFSQKPSYDFDFDKLAAFMCAYTYNFTGDGQQDEVPNWEWQDEYKDVLQKLFDTEYTFKHKYDDVSRWKQLNKYNFYAGGGSKNSYWTVYSEDFTRSQMKIRSVPSEIEQFCKDGYLHYDYDSLEVLDANDRDKKTGYFIQDQRFIIKDSSGNSNNPFYAVTTAGTYVWENGVDKNGKKKYENRSDWHWTDNNQQIYCVVNPSDTKKWNNTLDEICLINFYQKNYWYEDCSLYYTVQKNCSFDEACKKVLADKEKNSTDKNKYKDARLNFYAVLSAPQNKKGTKTYGNHQMLNAPVGGKSLQKLSGKTYNGYGYDIKAWNSEHCSITDCHKGIDFEVAKGNKVYAMCDGYINWINEGEQSLSIMTSQDIELWYDDKDKNNKNFPFEFIYENIKTSLKQGDSVKQGQVIGEVTDYKHCWQNQSNSKASKNYLHITVKIGYPKEFPQIGTDWLEVDPRYLIYRHENEGK